MAAVEDGRVKLFHLDAYMREFTSVVTRVRRLAGGVTAVALAETAFYPSSGGQPADQGRLDSFEVTDVLEEDGEIWHIVGVGSELPEGLCVTGSLNWERRFDHMQQHTGQHILSAAFLQALGAETLSVHIGATCTLDLDLPLLDDEAAARVEDLANTIVTENRLVTAREVEIDEAVAVGLRRPAKQAGRIRVTERDLETARMELLGYEARELLARTTSAGAPACAQGLLVVAAAYDGRAIEDLRALAKALTAQADCVAILASDPGRRVLVARSPAVAVDAAAVLRATVVAFGGRGGGKPEAAEGAAPGAPSTAALLEAARLALLRQQAPCEGGTVA